MPNEEREGTWYVSSTTDRTFRVTYGSILDESSIRDKWEKYKSEPKCDGCRDKLEEERHELHRKVLCGKCWKELTA